MTEATNIFAIIDELRENAKTINDEVGGVEKYFFMVFAKTFADLKIMRTFAPAIERESFERKTN